MSDRYLVMIGLAAFCVLWGTQYQSFKQRISAWSAWYPVFRLLGLSWGLLFEYLDLWATGLIVGLETRAMKYYVTALVLPAVLWILCVPAIRLHIYFTYTRWGWCYLVSSLHQQLWQSHTVCNKQSAMVLQWHSAGTRSNMLISIVFVRMCMITGVGMVVHANANNIIVGSWLVQGRGMALALHSTVALLVFLSYVGIVLRLQIMQLNPTLHDVALCTRVHKGYTANEDDFFDARFFRYYDMPWKFFGIVGLPGLYELSRGARGWRVYSNDQAVCCWVTDAYGAIMYARTMDQELWEQVKMYDILETYRELLWSTMVHNSAL